MCKIVTNNYSTRSNFLEKCLLKITDLMVYKEFTSVLVIWFLVNFKIIFVEWNVK